MSLPNIPDITPQIDLDRDQAITMLLASIAMEEMGLAHILNVEGEKLQYILSTKLKQEPCLSDLLAVNESIERVIKSVTKLQFMLQDKLENVIRLIPSSYEPCPAPKPPCPPRPKPCCTLKGSGVGCVNNLEDDFYGATVTLEALAKDSIKYCLTKRGKGRSITAALVPHSLGLHVHCPHLSACPRPEEPNLLVMKGKAMMCIIGLADDQQRATVKFTLQVWDYGIRRQLQMVTDSSNPIFIHNSGMVELTQGDLQIKSFASEQGSCE